MTIRGRDEVTRKRAMDTIAQRIAGELSRPQTHVAAAVRLLDDGATVPFVARYRKEATGGLTDVQLRVLQVRLKYLRELGERCTVILRSIEEQGKLTPEIEAAIRAADTKTRLEDLYVPFKPKRRSKASLARQAGLEGLAAALLADPGRSPEVEAAAYVAPDKGVTDVATALDGARAILIEQLSEDPNLVGELREMLWEHAKFQSRVLEGKQQSGAKFSDYFAASEPLKGVPSHRALALFRGRKEGSCGSTWCLTRRRRRTRAA